MRLLSIAQRGDRCANPRNIPDQVGWASEKPDIYGLSLDFFLLTACMHPVP